MSYQRGGFKKYIVAKQNVPWIISAALIALTYFVILRLLYPVPSFYSDSFTWVGAARTGQPVTFRPVGYSKIMMFFKLFSTSDIALIAAQYFSNVIINLFLFLTCTYFFILRNSFKILLFVLLFVNPFYLFYSNYISSDAFFTCFTVLWFTLLIWILNKPSWFLIIAQLVVLASLFELRYNAIFFPAISAIAICLSNMSIVKKASGIGIGFALIASIIFFTTIVTGRFTGTKTFSAFSGWQLANNALHIIQHEQVDTAALKDKEVKAFTKFAIHFFDTTKQDFPESGASAVFMWHINSPLKRYMRVYAGRSFSYFKTWNALGPVYNKFGKTLILQKPGTYLKYFVLPNATAYIFPALEIYETYMENNDTIASVARKYYKYKSNKTPSHHPGIYSMVFTPMRFLYIITHIIFIVSGIYYVTSGLFKKQLIVFNHTLLCYAAFFVANFFFIVLLAPSVIRYHIFIVTLSFPILLYLIQQIFVPHGDTRQDNFFEEGQLSYKE